MTRTRIIAPAFLFTVFLTVAAPAQTDEIGTKIDKIFAQYNKQDCPGCAVGVAKDGQVVYMHGYGLANLEYSVPITPETIFEAGSCSKQFTSASILLLAKDGKLSLDDDIHKYLPEVPNFGPKIAIRNLLNHTSGLRDQWTLLTAAGRPPGSAVHTLDEILYLVSRQKESTSRPARNISTATPVFPCSHGSSSAQAGNR